MSFAPRARKTLAVSTTLLVASAGLALSPLGLSAASASDASSSASIVASVNSYRASQEVAPLATNRFFTSFAQDWAAYAAKKKSIKAFPTKFTLPFPEEPTREDGTDNPGGEIVKVVHGSATSVAKYVKQLDSDELGSADFNYIAVGYAKNGSTVYATILLDEFTPAPYELLTESKPTVSGSLKVGSTLTAVSHFSDAPDAGTITYAWEYKGAVLGSDSTYVVQPADYGHKLTLTIAGSKDGYVGKDDETALVTSTLSESKAVAKGTITKGAVEVEGSRTVGSQLTATPDGWAPETVVFSYKWLRDGKSIKGAAAVDTYTQVAADKGHKINVEVTATSPDYTTTSKTTTSTTKTVTPAG